MKFLNKESSNEVENAIQQFLYRSRVSINSARLARFCFYRKRKNQPPEIIFVEVKRYDEDNIKPWQRKIKNLFRSVNLDYRVAFGLNENGTPRFRKDIP